MVRRAQKALMIKQGEDGTPVERALVRSQTGTLL